MKIERINDNQFRCTLDMADLAVRNIDLTELAYGTDKARMLFSDIMEKASHEFNFQVHNGPLMIEAIPMANRQLMLIISKVEQADELDTRFSTFSPAIMDGDRGQSASDQQPISAEDIIKTMRRLLTKEEPRTDSAKHSNADDDASPDDNADLTRTYLFRDVASMLKCAEILNPCYHEQNSLYRRPGREEFYLVVHKGNSTPYDFNRICNIITEFASQVKANYSYETYYIEHYELVIKDTALSVLAEKR